MEGCQTDNVIRLSIDNDMTFLYDQNHPSITGHPDISRKAQMADVPRPLRLESVIPSTTVSFHREYHIPTGYLSD